MVKISDILWLACLSLVMLFQRADSLCTMPFDGEEEYVSASIGTFTANSTHFVRYPVTIPTVPSPFDFYCYLKRNDQYVLRSVQEPSLFGTRTVYYMCIELHQVDNNTYYYLLGTEYDLLSRDYIKGDSAGSGGTFTNVCDRVTPYEPQTFVMLVKADAYNKGFLTTKCPDDIIAVFRSLNASSKAGTTSSCPGNTLDVCANRTTMVFSYNSSCSPRAKTTSTNGSYSCLYSTTVGETTYLGLWNQDNTVDRTHNYRYSCLAFKKVGGTVYATETPHFCKASTNATATSNDGVTLVIWDKDVTCLDVIPVTPEEPVNLSWLYYMIAGLVIFTVILCFICFFTWCYKKYGCICKKIKLPKVKLPKHK